MPKPILAALLLAAVGAVAALLLLGDGDPATTGLGETLTTAPATTTAGTGEPAPLTPATVAPASTAARTAGPIGPASATPNGSNGAAHTAPHEVAAGAPVRGVVRAPGGLPAAGAQVLLTVQTADGPKIRNTRTDAEGRFELMAPAAGRATVQVQASGLATVAVPVGAGNQVELDPPPAVEIAGIVRDGQGKPLAAAFVSAQEIGSPVTPARSLAQTGPDGKFRIGALRRDARYRLQGTHPELAPSEPVEVTAPAAGAALTLYEGATLVVKVFDADGGVLPAIPAKKKQAGWQALRSYAEVHGPGGSRTMSNWTTSDPSQLKLTGLSPGEYRVVLQVRGHGKVEKSDISVPRTGIVETEVQLTRGGWVVVKVLDEQGGPVPGAMAHYVPEAATPFGLLVVDETGDEGAARVGPLPAGTARIRVTRPGFTTAFAEAEVQVNLEVAAQVVLKSP